MWNRSLKAQILEYHVKIPEFIKRLPISHTLNRRIRFSDQSRCPAIFAHFHFHSPLFFTLPLLSATTQLKHISTHQNADFTVEESPLPWRAGEMQITLTLKQGGGECKLQFFWILTILWITGLQKGTNTNMLNIYHMLGLYHSPLYRKNPPQTHRGSLVWFQRNLNIHIHLFQCCLYG